MFNKSSANNNLGGTQVIVSDSKNVHVNMPVSANDKIAFSDMELQSIVQLADELLSYSGNALKQSEKTKLSSCLYEINENALDVEKCTSNIKEFQTIYNAISDIGKKTIVSVASAILSNSLLNLLGLL